MQRKLQLLYRFRKDALACLDKPILELTDLIRVREVVHASRLGALRNRLMGADESFGDMMRKQVNYLKDFENLKRQLDPPGVTHPEFKFGFELYSSILNMRQDFHSRKSYSNAKNPTLDASDIIRKAAASLNKKWNLSSPGRLYPARIINREWNSRTHTYEDERHPYAQAITDTLTHLFEREFGLTEAKLDDSDHDDDDE